MKCKRGMALLLAVALTVGVIPFVHGNAETGRAAGTSETSQFAEVEQLKTFNTDDTDGSENSAKVYFGNNNQEWWIAGNHGNSLTLFAASPLGPVKQFHPSYEMRTYSGDLECTYTDDEPIKVYPNHYGASLIRKTILKGLETSYFSSAEQDLMEATTVYTDDPLNSKVYFITDKLYLAYGDFTGENDKYITVGTNSSNVLNGDLRIDKEYWGKSSFWLRAPHTSGGNVARVADPDSQVEYYSVCDHYALVPAFELKLTSVIFASAAKAASSGTAETTGTIVDGTTMTLKLDGSDKTIGTVVYDEAEGNITAQKDADAAGTVSLVVQGNDGAKDWYYSVPAGETTVVTKEQIQTACNISGDISLADCKIWLETTIDNVAYAKMAEEKPAEEPIPTPTATPTPTPTATPTPLPTNSPTAKPTNPPTVPHPDETVSPEEVMKNSEKLDSGISVKWRGTNFLLGWQAVQKAQGYDIFAGKCGKKLKLGKKSLIKTVKGKKTSVKLSKIAGKKISGKKSYKFRIKAWKKTGGKKVYIGKSRTYHVSGRKNKKYTNAKKLIPAKKKYILKKGKKVRLKVRIVKQSKKKKLLLKTHGPALRYLSGKKKVATVTSKGKIRAKGKGTCYIYVTALNGIRVKIKVTVK